ncbi:MAG TPA: hypothetical protein VEU08_01390 [Vicinamibacterales bacterium]|nr:hypothetical protein [Vicinamibacterales bacterium]
MLSPTGRRFAFAVAAALAACLSASCQRVPLLAPSGSTITLTSATNALPAGGSTQIIAQVIEPSGTPPHSGTQITFTTTLGTLQPDQVETDASGRAITTFNAGGSNGTATITAISGGSSASGNSAIKIALGTAAVGGVRVSANPTQVPAFGGVSTITADVFDINGNALVSAPVVFTTSAGSLSNTLVNTNSSGIATSSLQTNVQATVTVTVGASGASGATGGTGSTTPTTGPQQGTVTVGVLAAPTLSITPPTTPPSAGLPSNYTFAVTAASSNGTPVRDVSVNWGGGTPLVQDLGAISGSTLVAHTYPSSDTSQTYSISATLTDASGNQIPVATSVTVIPVAPPTIIITPNVPSSCAPTSTSCTVTFTIQVTVPAGVTVQNATINYGDGATQNLGGLTGTATVIHTYTGTSAHGSVTVTVTVVDSVHANPTTGQTVVILP